MLYNYTREKNVVNMLFERKRALSRVCEEERTRKISIANDQPALSNGCTTEKERDKSHVCHHGIKAVPLKKGPMGSIKRER